MGLVEDDGELVRGVERAVGDGHEVGEGDVVIDGRLGIGETSVKGIDAQVRHDMSKEPPSSRIEKSQFTSAVKGIRVDAEGREDGTRQVFSLEGHGTADLDFASQSRNRVSGVGHEKTGRVCVGGDLITGDRGTIISGQGTVAIGIGAVIDERVQAKVHKGQDGGGKVTRLISTGTCQKRSRKYTQKLHGQQQRRVAGGGLAVELGLSDL